MSFRMEFLQFEMPWPESTRLAVQDLLKRHDPFILADPNIDQYDVLQFRQFQAHTDTPLLAIFDQNMLNDVVEIIQASLENRPPQRKGVQVAAAAMTFLQAANAMIEPGIAIHEKPDAASRLRDLQLFRCADEVPAELYADLALGKISRLPLQSLPAFPDKEKHRDFSKKIIGRSRQRVSMLKIACLVTDNLTPFERMREYLRWSFEDYIFLAIPTLLACSYLCSRPQKSILKKARSADRQRVLEEVENALWDVQLIENWAYRACEEQHGSRTILLCSNDQALKRLARLVCEPVDTPEKNRLKVQDYFIRYWGQKEGVSLSKIYFDYISQPNSSRRVAKESLSEQYVNGLALELEALLIAWNGN